MKFIFTLSLCSYTEKRGREGQRERERENEREEAGAPERNIKKRGSTPSTFYLPLWK
jgi:hypothetical protein